MRPKQVHRKVIFAQLNSEELAKLNFEELIDLEKSGLLHCL